MKSYQEQMWDENLGREQINPYRQYRIAKELNEKFPELRGKILTGIMNGQGDSMSIVSEGEYITYLWSERKGLCETMGAIIKENPRSRN